MTGKNVIFCLSCILTNILVHTILLNKAARIMAFNLTFNVCLRPNAPLVFTRLGSSGLNRLCLGTFAQTDSQNWMSIQTASS